MFKKSGAHFWNKLEKDLGLLRSGKFENSDSNSKLGSSGGRCEHLKIYLLGRNPGIPTPPISSTVFHENEKWSKRPKNYINRKVSRCLIDFVWLTRLFFFLFVRNCVLKFGICDIYLPFSTKMSKRLRFRGMRNSLRDVCSTHLIVRWNFNEPYFYVKKIKTQKYWKKSLKKMSKFCTFLTFCHWKQKWLMFDAQFIHFYNCVWGLW